MFQNRGAGLFDLFKSNVFARFPHCLCINSENEHCGLFSPQAFYRVIPCNPQALQYN